MYSSGNPITAQSAAPRLLGGAFPEDLRRSFASASLDLQLRQGACQGGINRSNFFGREFLTQASGRALTGFFGSGFVDTFGRHGHICQDSHSLTSYLNEPSTDG
jgi:hypothetical protein